MSTLEIIKDKLKQKRALQEISSCLTGKKTNQRINQKPLEKCVSYSLPTEYWFILSFYWKSGTCLFLVTIKPSTERVIMWSFLYSHIAA